MVNIDKITQGLWTGGDLPPDPAELAIDVADWQTAGITHVIDNRLEWSDEAPVADLAPAISYLHNGVDDAGQRMPDEWFDRGVGFALVALADRRAGVLAHCHMGINRGPSMAFAILLGLGWDAVEALDAIRTARPIAGLGYVDDALDWWSRRNGVSETERFRQRRRVAAWKTANHLDVAAVIRRIRSQERGA